MDGAARAAPILGLVVTTINAGSSVNCAAMGVEWGERRIVVKPFRGTRTLRNLRATEAAVVHLTDDVLLFSQAALGDPHPPTHPAVGIEGAVLDDACSWREVRVEAIDDAEPRTRVSTVVVNSGIGREFLGLNRACHAVVEASILASRARLLDAEDIQPSSAGCRFSWTRRPVRASARRWRTWRATCARWLEASERGPRRGARAPASPGMLAVANEGARRFGGLGVSVSRPAVVLEAQPADELSTEGAEAERALTFAQRSRDVLGLPGGARLRIVETIPPHVGLGSGTKLACGGAGAGGCMGARSMRRRWPRPPDARRGRRLGRGRSRSAVSWWRAECEEPRSAQRRCSCGIPYRTSGGSSSSCPRPSRGCRGSLRRRPSRSSCRRRSYRRRSRSAC